jgi:hypothetical protein
MTGFWVLQMAIASGQRVWKRQPEGGSSGDGTSPLRIVRAVRTVGFGTGFADSSARV